MDPKQIRLAVLSLIIVPFFAGMAAGEAIAKLPLIFHH